ncbi:FAD-dependent oxidoreductase [Eggerthellaceae bacterium 24-137]
MTKNANEFGNPGIAEEPAAVASTTIDRRGFLRGVGATALLGSLATLSGCATTAQNDSAEADTPAESLSVDSTEDCDIVIVGAGGSGLAAAVEAGEAGARVICVERQAAAGGGEAGVEGIFAVGSRMQEQEGETNISTGALIRQELEAAQQRVNGPHYIDMVHNSGDNVNWLLDHGVTFMSLDADNGEVKVFHRFEDDKGAVGYVPQMLKAAENAGVDFRYNTLANKIVMTDGRATGVIVTDANGSNIQINASSVIVATGGFAEDFDMVSQNGINTEDAVYVGMPGHDATGHNMLIEAGAKDYSHNTAYLMALAVRGLPGYFEGGKFSFLIGVAAPYSIWINENAERFVNENFSQVNAMLMTVPTWPNKKTHILMDQTMLDVYMNGEQDAVDQLNDGLASGEVVKADTVEALASAMDVDAAALADTMERYNGYCAAKDDADYGKEAEFLMSFDTAPYYGFHVTPDVQVAIGSIQTDRNFNAITNDGAPIEGLYVVGVEGAMLWANIYTINIPGGANANNINSGRTAARHALSRL